MKRLFDLVISLSLILCFSPVMLTVACLVRIKLGTPVVFKQPRIGVNGKSFVLYKFRTMTDERNGDGELLPDHMRLSPFGQFLRRYSLDELAQLVNVIKGDISLVGPRPLLTEYLSLYTEEQAQRHSVKPGITGWAQVSGRNAISWEEKFKLDVWYVHHHSFRLDIKILFLTLLAVLRPSGIHQPGNVTMERFKGSNSTIREGHG